MTATIGAPFKAESTVSSAAGPALTSGVVPAGRMLILADASGISGSNNTGLSGISADTNSFTVGRARAQRGNTGAVGLSDSQLSDALEASNPVTPTYTTSWSRKIAVAVDVDGLSGAVNAVGSGAVAIGSANSGSNGSGTTPSGGSLTTTVADCLIFAAIVSAGQNNTLTPGAGWTKLDEMFSTAASTYRNVALCYRVVSATGTYSFSGTLAATGGWAVVCAAYVIASPAADPPGIVRGNVKIPFTEFGIVRGGVKVPFIEMGIVRGGVKVPFV